MRFRRPNGRRNCLALRPILAVFQSRWLVSQRDRLAPKPVLAALRLRQPAGQRNCLALRPILAAHLPLAIIASRTTAS